MNGNSENGELDCDDFDEVDEEFTNTLCYDGSWSFAGNDGMMVELDSEDFMEDQYEDFLAEKEENPSLDMEEEFVPLDFDFSSEANMIQIKQCLINRNLHMADGVLRRRTENRCPPRIRIKRLEESEMKEMLEMKQRGNEMFGKGMYEDAIELYEEALLTVSDMYIAPKDQVEQIVVILSNQAECQLRLHLYDDAGQTATDALIYMGDHEKSRIRRVKAELAIGKQKKKGGYYYFIQAQNDLEQVLLNPDCTSAGREACEKLMAQVDRHLQRTKQAILKKNPGLDWEFLVRRIRCMCW